MAYRLGNVALSGPLRVRIGRTYDCRQIYQDLSLPDHVVPRVVRVRLDSRKDAFLAFVYGHKTPVRFIDPRPQAAHEEKDCRLAEYRTDLPSLEEAIKREYEREEVSIGELSYREMMVTFKGKVARDALKSCKGRQSDASEALGIPRSSLQYLIEHNVPVETDGPYFKTIIRLGRFDAMVEAFERALLQHAINDVGPDKPLIAKRLQVARSTISERLARLGFAI